MSIFNTDKRVAVFEEAVGVLTESFAGPHPHFGDVVCVGAVVGRLVVRH
jgi:hypothetical protein